MVMHDQGLPPRAQAALRLWKAANMLEGILWCKTCSRGSLQDLWSVVMQVCEIDFLSEGHCRSKCRLRFTRGGDEQAVPNGHIRVQDLTEGFALYREFRELNTHYGQQDARDIMGESQPRYTIAGHYLWEELGLPFSHPLSGALQECALLRFIDPFLCPGCDELDWDEIHPGLAFEKAVRKLVSAQSALPDSLIDAYEVAYEAYGLRSNPYWHIERQRILELTKEPVDQVTLDAEDSALENKLASKPVVHKFMRSFFLAALRLRSDHYNIFFEPQLYFPPAWNRFVSITIPPLLVNPSGIELPRVRDQRSARVNVSIIEHALVAGVLDDLGRHGVVRDSSEFVRSLRKSYPAFFPCEQEPDYFRNILGGCAIEAPRPCDDRSSNGRYFGCLRDCSRCSSGIADAKGS